MTFRDPPLLQPSSILTSVVVIHLCARTLSSAYSAVEVFVFFRYTFANLGIQLSEETVGPLQSIEFLGITLDSDLIQASLPLEKLNLEGLTCREHLATAANSELNIQSKT